MAKITFHNEPATTKRELPAVGSQAINFTAVGSDLKEKSLSNYKGHRVVLSIFPSVDTGVCAASVRKFNQEASSLNNTKVVCISNKYPLELLDSPLKGLLSRAIIVLDENQKVIYTEQVPETTDEPNYQAVLELLK